MKNGDNSNSEKILIASIPQNQGSSIWGSRDIKRFRTRHTFVLLNNKKIFWGFFGIRIYETWVNEKKISIFGPIAILSVP